jgi:hypothetical protein
MDLRRGVWPIHAASAQQSGIRRVGHGIHRNLRDIAEQEFQFASVGE